MRELSDSLHLRRFCLIPLDAQVPDESTVRKPTRRLGPETVAELSRLVIREGAAYRVGAEGRTSHLKRRHRLRRSRLKGSERERTRTGRAVLAHNVETHGRHA